MRKFLVALLVLLLAVSMVIPAVAQDTTSTDTVGRVRFAHFSPALTTAVVFQDGEIRYSGLRFEGVTRWSELEPGSYEFAVGGSSAIANAVISETIEVAAGDYLTLVAHGNNNPTLTVIAESLSDIPEGNARVTVFHAIEGAPPVDVLANGSPIITLLAYPGTVVNPDGLNDGVNTLDVPAAAYDLSVVLNGTSDSLVDLPGTELEAGISYLVTAIGTASSPAVVVIETDPASFVPAEEEVEETEEVEVTEEADAGDEEVEVTEEADAGDEEVEVTEEADTTEEADAGDEEADAGDEAASPANLVDVVAANPDLSLLAAALEAADPAVLETLTGTSNFTVFAPTNDAFEAALEELGLTLEEIAADTDLLTTVLQYHVVRGTINANLLRDGANLPTLSGDTIAVGVDSGTVTLNDTVTVTEADVIAPNGVVHIIDGVLLPSMD